MWINRNSFDSVDGTITLYDSASEPSIKTRNFDPSEVLLRPIYVTTNPIDRNATHRTIEASMKHSNLYETSIEDQWFQSKSHGIII